MKKSLELRTFESTLAGGILFVISFLQSIILVPLFLQYWGKEKYGVWLAVFSFVSLLKTLDLGHQNYVGNEFNKFYFIDKVYARRLLGSGFFISLLLGLLEILIFFIIFFIMKPDKIIGVSLNSGNEVGFKLSLFLFVIIWSVFGSLGGLLVRIILPIGLFAKSTYLAILNKLSELIVLFGAVVYSWSLSAVFFAFAIVNLLYSLIVFYYIKKVMPEFFPWWRLNDWKLGIKNFLLSIVLTVYAFIEQFNSSGIVLLVSKKIGLLAVPLFTTIRTVANMVLQITSMVTNPLSPEIIRYHSTGEKNKLICIFETNWFISGLLVNVPFLLMSPFMGNLYHWWTKGALSFNPTFYYLLSLSVAVINFGRPYLTYLSGINALKPMMIITVCRACLTIGLCILLVPFYGLTGIGIAIIAAELVSSFVLPSIMVSNRLHAGLQLLYDTQQLLGLSQILLLAVYYILYINIPDYKIAILIIFTSIMLLISLIQWRKLDEEVRLRLSSLLAKLSGKLHFWS